MSCEEIRELLVAVSLGTATADERAQVEAHLQECGLEHGEAGDVAAAAMLSQSAPEMAPPAALKSRLMAAAFGGDAATPPAAPTIAPVALPQNDNIVRPNWFRRVAGPYQVAAVLAVALVAMIVWNLDLRSQSEDEKFVHYYRGNTDNWMRVETELGTQGALVSLGGLETLEGDATYHLWATRGEETIFVGIFNTNAESQWSGEFDFAFTGDDRLWITAQAPEDGDGPQGDPVLRTRF